MTDRKESPSKESAAGPTTVIASDEQEEKFRCSFCAQIFSSRKEVLVHEWQHKERQTFSCTVCSRSFTNKNLFDRHVAVHNKLGQRGSLCNICNKTFRNHRELDKHHQKDHKGQKSFRCGICGLMYSWMDNLQKHMRVHVDKPIGCFRCHKSFRDEESFNQHTLVHKREDVEKRAQGLPVTPSTPETEDLGNIITIGMPGNLTSRVPARINIAPMQQKDIPIATNVMSLAKSAVAQHNTDKTMQGAETKAGENDVESGAVLDLTDPQQMAALLEGYINEDPLTSTAETMDMISALSVDTSGTDSRHSNTEPNTVDKSKNKSPNKIQKDSDKPLPTSASPKPGVKTITYTLAARSGANTVTSSTVQQTSSVTRSNELNISAQTLSEGTNQVILNGTLKRSNVTVVSAVVASPTGSLSYTSTNSKHADCGTGPMSATETMLLEQMDKPHKCHVCGECFKYEFTLNAHMPKHKEALPAWESRGVLVPYGAGVKSVVLPKAMPIKPYGCPVCQETFRYDSCLKAHFMKSHPNEYKEKFGVDPKVIQALNVPNPRYKRPYHRKTFPRPDPGKTEKQTPDNQNSKPKNQVKTDKEKMRKKIDSLVVETPKPVVPKSKKDRLRPMPPHLLAKEMEAQEAREKEEKERIEREEAERERKKKEEEERIQQEEEEKRKVAQEKASAETLVSDIPPASEESPEEQLTNNESEATIEMASEVQGDAAQNEQNSDVSLGKPLFIVPLFNPVDVNTENNISQPEQCVDTSAPILVQNNKANEVDIAQSQDFSDRKLETTTIDLSQLKEVTTPIIEEVLHKSPFKTVEVRNLPSPVDETPNEKINNTGSHLVTDNEMETDQSRDNTLEHPEIASSGPSSPEKTACGVQLSTNSELNDKTPIADSSNVSFDNTECSTDSDKLCTTPKKSSPKSKKPKTPKAIEPVHRILTRRKYAYDEEARFRAEREAAEQRETDCDQRDAVRDENMEMDSEERVNASSVDNRQDEIVEPQAMEITCESKETGMEGRENDKVESGDVEQISDQLSDITNRDMGVTDQVIEITSRHDMEVTDQVSEITNHDIGATDQATELTNHDMGVTDQVSEIANHDMRITDQFSERETSHDTGVTDQANEITNHGMEATDSMDVQSIQSESANSAASIITAKTSSEDEGVDTADVESQKSTSTETRIENAQSVKSDVQSEDGLETIVIILKDSEMNSKNVSESEQLTTPNSAEDANKKNSIEEWMDKTGGKQEARSRKGKHMRDLRNTLANNEEELEPRNLRRSTRSANEPKEKLTDEHKDDGSRVLRKRTKDHSSKNDNERVLRSSPQKDAVRSGAVRTLRSTASPVSVEKTQKCSRIRSHEVLKDNKELEIKLKRCTIPLVPSIIPMREKSSERKSKTSRDNSVDNESNSNVRSRLRKRQMSTESAEEPQKSTNREEKKSTERTLRRRISTESVESKDGSVKSHEPVEGGRRVLRRRLSANSLDSSASRSSSCPRRLRDPERKLELQDREDEFGRDRQLRKRLSPERGKEKAGTDYPGRSLRSNSQPSNTDRRAHVLPEREGKRSQSENVKSPRKLRSTRSSSWEEQAKALTKCSVKLLRCDTPVKHLDTADKENIDGEEIARVDMNEPSAEKENQNESETIEKEDTEKDPLLSVLEKETQLVLKHIQREKETMEAAEKEAQMEAQHAQEERSDEISEKDSADTISLEISEETDMVNDEVRKEADTLPNIDSLQKENENVESATSVPIVKEKTDKVQDTKESKESRKTKKSRSRKKGGSNIYELIRQQKDQIQTKVLGKSNHDISPKEKRRSPDSKKSSPELKEVPSEMKLSSEITEVSTVQSQVETSRRKKDKKRKKKSKERKEFDSSNEISVSGNSEVHVSNDVHTEKEIGIIIPVENVSDDVMKETSSKKQISPAKTKKTHEEKKYRSPEKNNEKENDSNEDLCQQMSPTKTMKTCEERKHRSPEKNNEKENVNNEDLNQLISQTKTKRTREDRKQISGEDDEDEEDSDDNEDLNQLLELATGRTLRSEVQKSPSKDQTRHIYPSTLRQNASDFEKAVHLSLLEAHKSRKEKKKKKKHKRDKRDSSPFSLPESCYHSVKTKKKKKKKKHKHREREKERRNSDEEKLLDLSEEQVELLEQSFELMMPDLFRQLTIQSPTNEIDQPFPVLSSMEAKSKKEKKSSPSQNKNPSQNKQHVHKKNSDKSPAKNSKSPRNDDKKSFYSHEKPGDEEFTSRYKSKTQSPKSPKPKKADTPPKSKNKSPVLPEALTRTTRAKHAKDQALEFQKQIQKDNPLSSENTVLKTNGKRTDRKANRKAEKEKKNKKEKQGSTDKERDKAKQKETSEKHEDRSHGRDDRNRSRDKHQDKRDKYDKRRDYEKRPRTENLFLQDISQTPKFFEHNIPLTNSLSQVPSNAAPIAPVQFPTLTDPSRKRTLDSLLPTEPQPKSQTVENETINAPPPKRKRGRPPKASKVKQNAPPPPVPVMTAAPIALTPHIAPVFGNPLSSNVFGSISGVENPANTVPVPVSPPKEKSNKKGKKRKRDSSGRIEIRGHEIVYMEEKCDSTSENSLGAEVGGEDHVMDEVEIKQEVESSEAEDGCADSHMHSNEVEEGREVIMVSVATMTDSSYLMDLRRLMLEQEQMEAEAAAAAAVTSGESDREPTRTEPNSPRLTVKLYRCDYCTRPFTQRSWMVLHKLREHGYSCQSQAIYMHTLARRVIRRVLIDWRRHGCESCNRRFNHKAHYIFHRSSEHRRKQYRCGVCNLTSDSYMLYQMHAVFVHKAVMMK